MIRVAKWIYGLGVKHERRRIKLLIAEVRQNKPEQPTNLGKEDDRQRKDYDKRLGVWYEVTEELNKLTDPFYGEVYEQTAKIPRIDEEL